MSDGKIQYSKSFEWEGDQKAIIKFTPVAFAKMVMLVQNFSKEVAWHGVAVRDEEQANLFTISDILVYPQVVTGGTVETDQTEYANWLYSHDDDVFNNVRMQGHSHVNFSVNPSAVDTSHQEKILEQLEDDMFYIFMIWNKSFEYTAKIYDMKHNTLYENKDVVITIGDNGVNLEEFIKGAQGFVKEKSYTTTQQTSIQNTNTSESKQTNNSDNQYWKQHNNNNNGKKKGKAKIGSGWGGANNSYFHYPYTDESEEYYGS